MQIKIKRREFLLEMARNFLNQKDLADKLELTPQAINAILKERSGTSLDTAKKVCTLFKCDFDAIFEVSEE